MDKKTILANHLVGDHPIDVVAALLECFGQQPKGALDIAGRMSGDILILCRDKARRVSGIGHLVAE